jgi:hypothetical protein
MMELMGYVRTIDTIELCGKILKQHQQW